MDVKSELEEIYRRHYLTVYRLALAKCGGKTENAKDVFGEVFFQLLRYLNKGKAFNDTNHEKAWLIRVTVNCSKAVLRTYASVKTEELNENSGYVMPFEESGEVYEAVMKLSERYRIVIHLFYFEDYSIKEIAEILKLKENTVKSRLSRARKMLKSDITIQERKGKEYEFGKI